MRAPLAALLLLTAASLTAPPVARAAETLPAPTPRYVCVLPNGQTACVLDSATTGTGEPTAICDRHCPACQGACLGRRDFETKAGHGRLTIRPEAYDSGPNIVVPGPDDTETAKKILDGGLIYEPDKKP